MSNEASAPGRFLLDEFNTLKGDDELREKLRSIDGVPAVSYQVQGEKVFVFEKLVQLVKQNGHKRDITNCMIVLCGLHGQRLKRADIHMIFRVQQLVNTPGEQ